MFCGGCCVWLVFVVAWLAGAFSYEEAVDCFCLCLSLLVVAIVYVYYNIKISLKNQNAHPYKHKNCYDMRQMIKVVSWIKQLRLIEGWN